MITGNIVIVKSSRRGAVEDVLERDLALIEHLVYRLVIGHGKRQTYSFFLLSVILRRLPSHPGHQELDGETPKC